MSADDLLDLAVRHELGHALCNETSEAKASRAANTLQEGKALSCEARVTAKMRTEEKEQLMTLDYRELWSADGPGRSVPEVLINPLTTRYLKM
jgi:hypothetical protein